MITVKLQGGLGNQLFQYAFGSGLTADHGYYVKFDRESLGDGVLFGDTRREYGLGFLGAPLTVAPRSGSTVIRENGLRFNPIYQRPSDPATMYGYWQTEKYFPKDTERFRGFIMSHLLPETSGLSPEGFRLYHKIVQDNSVFVHVRRQDYLHLQAYHGMPDLNYYRQGVKLIRERHHDAAGTFVFSDDPQWCHEHFPSNFNVVQGTSKYEDLKLMSMCRHGVIANSTFSWWGAWLGENQTHRTIVAPAQWFADPIVDYQDIVPERWMKI